EQVAIGEDVVPALLVRSFLHALDPLLAFAPPVLVPGAGVVESQLVADEVLIAMDIAGWIRQGVSGLGCRACGRLGTSRRQLLGSLFVSGFLGGGSRRCFRRQFGQKQLVPLVVFVAVAPVPAHQDKLLAQEVAAEFV